MSPVSRRTFIHTAGLAAGGWALGSRSLAIEPIGRNETHKFKFSLAAYSYRNLLKGAKGQAPTLTLEDFIRDCAAFGLDGTELTSYYFPDPVDNNYLCKLKHLAFTLGLDITGTAVGNDFCLPTGPERDKQLALVKRWVDYSAVMGAPVIRIFSGKAGAGQTPEQAQKLALEAIEECCDYAGRKGVILALENHGGLTTSVDGMLSLVKAVSSPWFAVNLDSGNFHGEGLYDDLARIAPYAMNVQIKVVVQKQPGKKTPSDFVRLASMMRDVGYRGYIVLEYEEPENPREQCPKFIDELRKAFV